MQHATNSTPVTTTSLKNKVEEEEIPSITSSSKDKKSSYEETEKKRIILTEELNLPPQSIMAAEEAVTTPTIPTPTSHPFLGYHGYAHTLQYFPPQPSCGGGSGEPITTVDSGNMEHHHCDDNNRFIRHNDSFIAAAADSTMTFPYFQDFPSSETMTSIATATTARLDDHTGNEKSPIGHFSTTISSGDFDETGDKRKKHGQQKRSWNTENYQWMNIKRTRKLQRPGELICTILYKGIPP